MILNSILCVLIDARVNVSPHELKINIPLIFTQAVNQNYKLHWAVLLDEPSSNKTSKEYISKSQLEQKEDKTRIYSIK